MIVFQLTEKGEQKVKISKNKLRIIKDGFDSSVPYIIETLFQMKDIPITDSKFIYVAIIDKNGVVRIEERMRITCSLPGKHIIVCHMLGKKTKDGIAEEIDEKMSYYWTRVIKRALDEIIIRMSP